MFRSNILKVLSILTIFILTIIVGTTEVNAMSMYVGELQGQPDLYCVQQFSNFYSGNYNEFAHVKIVGKTATNVSTGKSNTSALNAKLAYYVAGGSDSEFGSGEGYTSQGYSARQNAIWQTLGDVWLPGPGANIGLTPWATRGTDHYSSALTKLRQEANTYAKSKLAIASIENVGAKEVKESGKMIGPFKVKYTGTVTGILVRGTDGKPISKKSLKLYSDSEGKNEIKNITSKANFYIKNTSGTSVKNIKIMVKGDEVLSADLYFLQNTSCASQRLMYVERGSEKSEESITIDVKNEPTPTSTPTPTPTLTPTPEISDTLTITGLVWIDVVPNTKADANSLYDEGEPLVKGVKVNLRNKSDGKILKTVETNDKGEYRFEGVNKKYLSNYYLEYNYNGVKVQNGANLEDVSKYIPVAFNSEDINKIVKNGSRALMDEVAQKDVDLLGIATTYKGTEKENTYGLSGNLFNKLYNESTKSLEYINLGIKKIPEAEYKLTQDLAYVDVTMKGYTYRYNYGGKGNSKAISAPQISWQSGTSISAYSRAIYPSDISYDIKNSTEELKVNVTYEIDITNTNNRTADSLKELYHEEKLHILNISNKFDTNRYVLSDSNWNAEGNVVVIKPEYLKDIKENGIEVEKTASKYITFSIKHNALLKILQNPNGIIEDFPTETTTVGCHEYTREDYSWKNDINKKQTHYTSNDTRKHQAPYLILKLGEQREITGKVFEDKATEGSSKGNGKIDNEEKNVQGVIVELLDNSDNIANANISHLYNLNSDGTAKISRAITKTNEYGDYVFSGIIPGDYYIKFVYGNGNYKITDVSGNTIGEGKLNSKISDGTEVNPKKYEATTITSQVTKNAIQTQDSVEDTKHQWYKDLEGDNYSVATDIETVRNDINSEKTLNMEANVTKVSITVENDKGNIVQEVPSGAQQKRIYKGFNFGIISRKTETLKIEKVISHIKLINAQNNVIFDGNPKSDMMKGVTDLSFGVSEHGSTYVRAEYDEEELYGSTMQITYTITVTNTSDVRYYDGKEVAISVNEITDIMTPQLKVMSLKGAKTIKEAGIDDEGHKIYKITDLENPYIFSEKRTATDKKATSTSIELTAERILSKNDEMHTVNKAQVTNAKAVVQKTGTRIASILSTDAIVAEAVKYAQFEGVGEVDNSDYSKAETTVTPPTGENKQLTIYVCIFMLNILFIALFMVVYLKNKNNKQ